MASGICPVADSRTAQWRPAELPSGGQVFCPQASGVTPFPAVAWVSRMLSPAVRTMWAWCSSRATVALAMVLGINSSKPAGVKVARQRDEAFLVGGADDAVERFGGFGGDRQQAYVVDHDDVGSHDAFGGFGCGVVGAVAAHERAEVTNTSVGRPEASRATLWAAYWRRWRPE